MEDRTNYHSALIEIRELKEQLAQCEKERDRLKETLDQRREAGPRNYVHREWFDEVQGQRDALKADPEDDQCVNEAITKIRNALSHSERADR